VVYLQRLLQINMATLAASGALLLGMGRRSPAVPLLVLLAALASIWLTDIAGWFRLNRTVGSLAALLAAAISLRGLYLHGELDILAIANFLVYVQIILLFEEKDGRVYWLLAGVSLLQVVAATAFSQGVWFGVLVVAYMLVGLSALALLLLYRQWDRHQPGAQLPPPAAGEDRRWPLADQQPHFTTAPAGHAEARIGGELFGRLGRIGLGTVAFTVLLFFAVPRLGGTAWRGTLPSPTHVVGFSPKVTLGELGEIIESRDEVLRIRFFDRAGRPYRVMGGIYLHGATLLEYSQGQWTAETSASPGGVVPLTAAKRLPADGLVRQECDIEPLDRRELFYVMPVIATSLDRSVRVDRSRGRLLRVRDRRPRRFSYELGTTALVDGVQQPLVPNVHIASTDAAPPPSTSPVPEGLPTLVALADRWIAESGLPPQERVGRARYLQRMLAGSGRFQYSLEPQSRDSSIDPIEDFVAHNPRGHCEYFATALTLMLCSQQIPARMVVGYKCDEFNELGGFYQVRQSDAHTWVEAYLPPEQLKDLPPELLHGKGYWDWSAGGWLRLDPTPAAREDQTTGFVGSVFRRIGQAVDWLESLWANYVLEMDRQRQREAVYQPVVRAVRSAIRSLRDPQWWCALLEKMGWALDISQEGAGFWVRLGLIFPAGLLVLVLAVRWLRRPLQWLSARLTGRSGRVVGRHRARVEFYNRLETLLARQGLVRSAGQTQHEFATVAGTRIAAIAGRPQLARLPVRVVDAFYQVRFGQLPLDSSQTEAVEHALAELAACGEQAYRSSRNAGRAQP
jgi:transglutaminase-like putative cysteine protease